MDSHQKLSTLCDELSKSNRDENGYGGELRHRAIIDGWDIRIISSDFGDVVISGKKEEKVMAFELNRYEWYPILKNMEENDLDLIANLVKNAEWGLIE